jgi:hypothetical protein
MPNHIPDVARIADQMRRGFPDGTNDLHKELPYLFRRIQELENALEPFARVAVAEKRSNPQFQLVEFSNVYLKDCINAEHVLNEAYGIRPPINNFFSLPAEG